MLLVNYRPEYQHRWSSRSYYRELKLEPLDAEDIELMLQQLLGRDPALDPIKHLVTERGDGNPFFIEELVRALFDQQVLTGNGDVRLARPISQAQLPVTLQGVITSRIDRLPLKHKGLLQTLAVIGREFSAELAEKVVVQSNEVGLMLSALQGADFIGSVSIVGGKRERRHHLTSSLKDSHSLAGE